MRTVPMGYYIYTKDDHGYSQFRGNGDALFAIYSPSYEELS